MGHSSSNMEDHSAKSDVNYGSLAKKISREKNISKWPRLLMVFWQRICLLYVFVLKICQRLN